MLVRSIHLRNILVVVVLLALNGCVGSSDSIEASDGTVQRDNIETQGVIANTVLGLVMANVGGSKIVRTRVQQVATGMAVGAVAGKIAGKIVADTTQGYATQEQNLYKKEKMYITKTKELKRKTATRDSSSLSNATQETTQKVTNNDFADKFMDK